MKRFALVAVAALVLSGCSAPSTFDGYVHAECGVTDANQVTNCSVTQKPVPTVTATVTAAPAPTATATPTPTATATPTPAPTATATPTPTATATPTPTPTPTSGAVVPVGGPAGNWTLKFSDDFNGTSLDATKWAGCWFPPTCGTMNHVLTPQSNVTVTNGEAVLTLSDSGHGALISTNPNGGAKPGYQFTTGYIEARILFPGNGTANGCYNWPAFWTDGQSWPANGEHDIAEPLSGTMTVNYHSGGPNSKNQGAVPGIWCGGYHTYGLQRLTNSANVYYDGVLVKSYATDEISPQYIIVNAGDGGSIHQYGAASQVHVDYVRAWQ